MSTTRLEAFSDGVIAILITIMVLELKAPHEATLGAMRELTPVFVSYVLSFVYLGIYWNNHHHMLHAVRSVTGGILWANLHLLFWLSLVPFATAWMGENHFAPITLALYGVMLLNSAIAFTMLQVRIARHEGPDSAFVRSLGSDLKGKLSLLLYVLGIVLAFVNPWLSGACYVAVAVMWLVPDARFERALAETTG